MVRKFTKTWTVMSKKQLEEIFDTLYSLAWLIFAVACVLSSCGEKDPPPSLNEQLRGTWERHWFDAVNRYQFDGHGQCLTYTTLPAQPVHFVAYAYTAKGDTLRMLDLGGGEVSVFTVEFPTETTAVLGRVDGVNYFLKRI